MYRIGEDCHAVCQYPPYKLDDSEQEVQEESYLDVLHIIVPVMMFVHKYIAV